MAKTALRKWIRDVSPEDRVGDAAARTLKARFDAVHHYLPLAVKKAEEDSEYIHQLRVWTRRMSAALRIYGAFLPHRKTAWIRKQLKHVRRAAGAARDYDVLADLLLHRMPYQDEIWQKNIKKQRAEAQKPLTAIYRRLRHHHFKRRMAELIERIRGNGRNAPHFGIWAKVRLKPLVVDFFKAIPTEKSDYKTLHRFRIKAKKLRYAMELLSGAFPTRFREEIYPQIEALLNQLGKINDLAVMQEKLQERINLADAAEADLLKKLLTENKTLSLRAYREFFHYCTPDFLQALHADFSRILKSSLPTCHPACDTSSSLPPRQRAVRHLPNSHTPPRHG